MCTFLHIAFIIFKIKVKFFEKKIKIKTIFLGVLAHFTTFLKNKIVRSGLPLCYHTDESVIPQARQYYFYSRGIIGVIIHGHVIKCNIALLRKTKTNIWPAGIIPLIYSDLTRFIPITCWIHLTKRFLINFIQPMLSFTKVAIPLTVRI